MVHLGEINYIELFARVKRIGLEKLDAEENGYLITLCLWLKEALILIGDLGCMEEFNERLRKAIKDFGEECERNAL